MLHGATAIVSAVSVRAKASIEGTGALVLQSGVRSHLVRESGIFERTPGTLLANAVLKQLEREHFESLRGTLRLDTLDFSIPRGEKRVKFGLGSSAALTVALTALIFELAPKGAPNDKKSLFEISQKAHELVSPGGSGVDVAAAVFGGNFLYTRGEPKARKALTQLCPPELKALAVFSGSAQSTSSFIEKVRDFQRADSAAHDAIMSRIKNASALMAKSGDPREYCKAVGEHLEAERELGERAGADIVSAPHALIAATARTHGGAAKPSGAGGGDVAIAFVPKENVALFEGDLLRAGLQVLPLTFGDLGVSEG